jgi:hypothetical protein
MTSEPVAELESLLIATGEAKLGKFAGTVAAAIETGYRAAEEIIVGSTSI